MCSVHVPVVVPCCSLQVSVDRSSTHTHWTACSGPPVHKGRTEAAEVLVVVPVHTGRTEGAEVLVVVPVHKGRTEGAEVLVVVLYIRVGQREQKYL